MNEQNYENTSVKPSESKAVSPFSTAEAIFAWCTLLFGYLFWRVFPVFSNPFGGFLFALSLFAVTTVIIRLKHRAIGVYPTAIMCSAMIVLLALILSSNPFIHWIAFCYACLAYVYYVYIAFGNGIQKGLGDYSLLDFIKALFFMPFTSIAQVFYAAFGKRKKGTRVIIGLIIGIGLAIVPTAVIALLLSFDKGFVAIMRSIFNFSPFEVISHILSLVYGIPLGMYIFGLYNSSSKSIKNESASVEKYKKVGKHIRLLPELAAVTAILPILFLYVIFFISQWNNYIAAFTGGLPNDSTIYSEYARRGFFELCGVSVINLFLMALGAVFTRRKTNEADIEKHGIFIRITNTVLSVFTLVLISTAMSKLVLYIKIYGLTPKRVYAAWFMVILALIFVFMVIKQFVKRFNLTAAVVLTSVLMFGILSLGGTDRLIAKYNVDRCIAGSLSEIDYDAMKELGDSAIPELVRYRDALADKDDLRYSKAYGYLKNYRNQELGDDIFGITVPRELARKALNK